MMFEINRPLWESPIDGKHRSLPEAAVMILATVGPDACDSSKLYIGGVDRDNWTRRVTLSLLGVVGQHFGCEGCLRPYNLPQTTTPRETSAARAGSAKLSHFLGQWKSPHYLASSVRAGLERAALFCIG
jgi:hypothetical protein